MKADAARTLFRSDGLPPGSLMKTDQIVVTGCSNSRFFIPDSPP